MGKASRDKGARREREIAALLGAKKVSGYMKPGPDLVWRNRQVEVKAREAGWRMLYRWLQDVPILCVKADHQDWLVVMRVSEMLDLLDEPEPGHCAECRHPLDRHKKREGKVSCITFGCVCVS